MNAALKKNACGFPRKTRLAVALGLSLVGIFTISPAAWAQSTSAVQVAPSTTGDGDTQVDIRTEGKRDPRALGDSASAFRENRRVDVALPPRADAAGEKKVTATGSFVINLPDGGKVWATQDPAKVTPVLNVSTSSTLPVNTDGALAQPVTFSVYTNYAAFIDHLEVLVYRGTDTDLVSPLATLTPKVGNVIQATWSGKVSGKQRLRPGDSLIYVLRAYDAQGHVDETTQKTIKLVRPEDYQRSLRQLRDSVQQTNLATLSSEQVQNKLVEDETFGQNNLRQQNIPLYGSRVRVLGQDIPEDDQLLVDGQSYPVDLNRRFVAEFLLPIGKHTFDLELKRPHGQAPIHYPLSVDVTGQYTFLVALADVTASEGSVGGDVEASELGENYDDFLVDGRLAFYLKKKINGKYLITAQTDTKEREIDDLFTGYFDKNPTDIFRRLDPDQYYPVYGDDSTTTRDVDTMGKLYLRMDWDKNQVVWGNYNTGFTGTELAQYSRSLYGAAAKWRSQDTTSLGEPKSQWRVFGSEAQTAHGHSELLGTGGSVYYLRHTDLLPGSDKIVLEVTDPTTGRVEDRIPLTSGTDYQIDYLQGRIILNRPLSQISRSNLPSLIRDRPLGGSSNRLVADYEYIPGGFSADNLAAGVRGKQWFGDHVGVGFTYVDENRAGDDYKLAGGDVTLQAGRGTYLKLEYAKTDATQAPVFYSDNGGLSYTRMNPVTDTEDEGAARSVEARVNLRELGWTSRDWSFGAWWRHLDSGYSTVLRDTDEKETETGVEFIGQVTDTVKMSGRASKYRLGDDSLKQLQWLLDWQIDPNDGLSGEIRSVRETSGTYSADGLLGALQYTRRLTENLDVYGIAQVTLDDDGGRYRDNDAYTVGSHYLFGQQSSVGLEQTWGDRGDATSIDVNYQRTPDHDMYARYTWSTDTSERLFDTLGNKPFGLTVGQRWRLTDHVSMYNESQQLKEGSDTGIAHTYGMDFLVGSGWSLGFTLQNGELDALSGKVDRNALSVSGGFHSKDAEWNSRVEYRKDRGAEHRDQWATTNSLMYKLNQSWRVAARVNYSDTDDKLNPLASAKFTEANLGFAWRPWDNSRWALLGRYTYLYDLSSLGQETDSDVDQRSQVLSLEGIYRLDARWEFAAKLARRTGEVREGRGTGAWYDSTANFAALQVRYHLIKKWDAMAEYRWLDVDVADSTRQGWLVGVDRRLNDFFRIGVGYNFTDFSDRLTHQDYDQRGWFLNIVGSY